MACRATEVRTLHRHRRGRPRHTFPLPPPLDPVPSAQGWLAGVDPAVPGVRVNPLDYQVCIIGASPSSDIFVDNPYISRMHAQIVYENQRSRIRDLDSKNGTFVNRTRLSIEE